MGAKKKKPKNKSSNNYQKPNYEDISVDEIIEICVKKGLIERTDYGYYFKPEFFETLDIYKQLKL